MASKSPAIHLWKTSGNPVLIRGLMNVLMGEGFILLTRDSSFMGGVPPPFDTLKICTWSYDIKLKLYR